jgi:hypothetical protein
MDLNIESRKISLINWITRLQDDKVISRLEKVVSEEGDWWDDLPIEVQQSIEQGIAEADRGELISHQRLYTINSKNSSSIPLA